MTRSDRRHVARPPSALRPVLLWSAPALVLAAAVLIYAGANVVATVAGCVGLFVIVLIVYVLDRSGLMRPPPVQQRELPPPAPVQPQWPQPGPPPATPQQPPGATPRPDGHPPAGYDR